MSRVSEDTLCLGDIEQSYILKKWGDLKTERDRELEPMI